MTTKLKVGLIVDNEIVSKRINDLVQYSLPSEKYDITCIIVQKADRAGNIVSKIWRYIKRRGIKKFIQNGSFKMLTKFERFLLTIHPRFKNKNKDFFKTFDLRQYKIDLLKVYPNISPSGLVYQYTKEDLANIKDKKLDLMIREDGGILRGDVLTICPKGIISFHHADNDINRGGPPGFWEVFNKEKRTGFIIQLLKSELDGGDVLYKGYIQTDRHYLINLIRLYEISNVFLHRAIESLATKNPTLNILPKSPYAYQFYTAPTVMQQIQYLIRTMMMISQQVYQKLVNHSYRWGVAYQYAESWDDVTLHKSTKIKNPPNHFLADPFVWHKNGQHYCFVENFSYQKQKAVISVIEITKNGYGQPQVALEEDFHLSYPFLFENKGTLYMCPESCENKDIRLYKCAQFPLKWKLEKVLIKDIEAADTNIFYRDGKWWLMTSICSGHQDNLNELHIFWSNDLLSNNWHPHPKNPVIFDPLQARNGGLLTKDNEYYRVFQIQGASYMYGEAFGVAKIIELSETNYKEDIEFKVYPEFFKNIKGTHSYSFKDGLMAIDFVEIANCNK